MNCNEYIVPVQIEDFCNGKRYDTRCIFSSDAFTLLDLSADSSLDVILNAFVVALNAQNTRLNAQDLLIADLEARIEILEA
jgi:hypothetical protein